MLPTRVPGYELVSSSRRRAHRVTSSMSVGANSWYSSRLSTPRQGKHRWHRTRADSEAFALGARRGPRRTAQPDPRHQRQQAQARRRVATTAIDATMNTFSVNPSQTHCVCHPGHDRHSEWTNDGHLSGPKADEGGGGGTVQLVSSPPLFTFSPSPQHRSASAHQ